MPSKTEKEWIKLLKHLFEQPVVFDQTPSRVLEKAGNIDLFQIFPDSVQIQFKFHTAPIECYHYYWIVCVGSLYAHLGREDRPSRIEPSSASVF